MHEIETWAPGSAACALCVINISSHETGRPAGRGGGGPGPHGPPLDPPLITDVKRRYRKHCNVNKMADSSGLGPSKFITLLTL